MRDALLRGVLIGALSLSACTMRHPETASTDDTWLVDPTSVVPSHKPNSYLLCPKGACVAPADGTSPVFPTGKERLEQAWLELMRDQPRVELLAEDRERHLYLFRQRSAVFRFPDLIAVRFLDADAGSTLAVFSRSVYGSYDFGVNRRRIED